MKLLSLSHLIMLSLSCWHWVQVGVVLIYVYFTLKKSINKPLVNQTYRWELYSLEGIKKPDLLYSFLVLGKKKEHRQKYRRVLGSVLFFLYDIL